jgi:dihydrofolate synthase/folylpolyglutamate synthase
MGRINYERSAAIPYNKRQLKLDRMRQLLVRLGQPDAGMKIVHVAGTKGKGSTAAMIAAMLSAAGYRAGIFSSPHLHRIEERFAVDGQPCTSGELIALVDRLRPIVRAMDNEAAAEGDAAGGPTYFDITTAMALLHFVERSVDATVLEVGLGGRLDSTNVCLPVVSVITSISFDHMKQLGRTLAEIAREKAGIIKPGVPVVCGVTDPEPQQVIAAIAREHGCRLIQLGSDFRFRYHPPIAAKPGVEYSSKNRQPSPLLRSAGSLSASQGSIDFEFCIPGQVFGLAAIPLAMRGPHQAANAAVALAVIAELRHQAWCVSGDAMRLGLSNAALPGRVEIVTGRPTAILDAAHNPASARALIKALAEMPATGRRTLVLSISHDKDVPAIVDELSPHFDRFIVTEYQENPRAVPAGKLAAIVRHAIRDAGREILVCSTPREAWHLACRTAAAGELVCITGSFYLAAEMRQLVLGSATATAAG